MPHEVEAQYMTTPSFCILLAVSGPHRALLTKQSMWTLPQLARFLVELCSELGSVLVWSWAHWESCWLAGVHMLRAKIDEEIKRQSRKIKEPRWQEKYQVGLEMYSIQGLFPSARWQQQQPGSSFVLMNPNTPPFPFLNAGCNTKPPPSIERERSLVGYPPHANNRKHRDMMQ